MKAIEAANVFLALSASQGEAGSSVTNMKLQKLLYFSQEDSLRKRGKPLFADPLEAWRYGPVVPFVYQTFQRYGREPIPSQKTLTQAAQGLTLEEIGILTSVYTRLEGKSASRLMALTHEKGTPWSSASQSGEYKRITLESIRRYVRKEGHRSLLKGSTSRSDKLLMIPDECESR